MKYNFDEIIDRRHTSCMNTDGFRQYIFHADENMKFPYADEEFIRMWIADMEFATPDCIIDGIQKRLDRKIFGYTRLFVFSGISGMDQKTVWLDISSVRSLHIPWSYPCVI